MNANLTSHGINKSNIMKDLITVIVTFLTALVGAAIPLSCAYFVWSWAMAAVPAGAYAALIKVLVSILLFMVGGGLTIWAVVVAVALGGMLALAVCGALFD
jgi:hypothetical protein